MGNKLAIAQAEQNIVWRPIRSDQDQKVGIALLCNVALSNAGRVAVSVASRHYEQLIRHPYQTYAV